MDRITRNELLSLAAPGTGPRVSIYLPLVRTYPETQQNPVRVRHALDEAERQLVNHGESEAQANRLLAGARAVSSNDELVQLNTTSSLALLIEEGKVHTYFLPYPCAQSIDIGPGFYLAPLMRLLVWPTDFFLLALSGNAVRLFRCTRRQMTPVELPAAVPQSLEVFLRGTEFGRPTRFQTGAGTGPKGPSIGVVHGGTSYKDDAHIHVREYVQSVAKHVAAITEKDAHPLVLVAVGELHPVFRDAYPGPNLVEPGVHGSPDELGQAEMRARAVSLVETGHWGELKSALDRYRQVADAPHGSRDVVRIVPAAVAGRIDSLIAAFGERLWGTWDAAAQRVDVAADQTARSGQVDLIDLSLVETLRHGGHVCVVPRSDVPGEATMAAVLRW